MLQLASLANMPLPAMAVPTHWKEQTIEPLAEPLVALSGLQNPSLLLEPAYFLQGIPYAIEEMYARVSIAAKLVAVAAQLPTGYRLLIWDAWRPLPVQQTLFDMQCQVLRAQYPELTENEICLQTETYVSVPSHHPLHPSPHYTGGAVDLTLADSEGQPLPMGTAFDTFDARSRTYALEERSQQGLALSREELAGLHNRRILYHLMSMHGFTNYSEEWWHFDYGNQFWSAATCQTAIYTGIEP